MRINTNLKTLTHKEIRQIVDKTIGICEVKFGVNKRKGYCKVIVKAQSKNDDFLKYGEYQPDTHTIIVFKNNCKNVNDLIETTLHEYTHTLQPVASKYFKMLKKYGYENHPMEIEAIENEKYCKEVWKLIKQSGDGSPIYLGSNPTRNGDRTDDRFESCPDYKYSVTNT